MTWLKYIKFVMFSQLLKGYHNIRQIPQIFIILMGCTKQSRQKNDIAILLFHFFFSFYFKVSCLWKIFQALSESLLPTAPPKVHECWMLVLNRGKLLRSIITGHRERERGAAWETKADYLQYIKPLGASGRNIAKGTTDPRIEFILPK